MANGQNLYPRAVAALLLGSTVAMAGEYQNLDAYRLASGTGSELAACENRLTMGSRKIIIDPPSDLPVRTGSACNDGTGG